MSSETLKTAGAVLVGLAVASVPFLTFTAGHGHSAAAPHSDHGPRLGGQLSMVSDHHLELVRRDGRIHVYASDARRVPVTIEHGTARFDEGKAAALQRERFSVSAPEPVQADQVALNIRLRDGTTLATEFALD